MNIEYRWIGWMNEGTHDKIWGSFVIDKMWYTFWGRRGKRLNFKKMGTYANWDVQKLIDQKEGKGYRRVFMPIDHIWPDFGNEIEQYLSYKMLVGGVR